jgi:hypothetical protein
MFKITAWPVFALCICVFVVLALHSPAHAMEECKTSNPALNFKTGTSQTQYIRTKSSKDLTQMHGGGAQGSYIGGLGGGELGFKTEARFEIQTQGNAACVKLKSVNVLFYSKPQVHIASNFSRSSCEYNAVMAHEKKHISTLLKFQREIAPKVKAKIRSMINGIDPDIGPISPADTQKAQKAIQARLSASFQAYSDLMMPIVEQRQQAIDTPAEYARVSAQCKKWDEKLAKQPKSK